MFGDMNNMVDMSLANKIAGLTKRNKTLTDTCTRLGHKLGKSETALIEAISIMKRQNTVLDGYESSCNGLLDDIDGWRDMYHRVNNDRDALTRNTRRLRVKLRNQLYIIFMAMIAIIGLTITLILNQ